jgi:hypothetical protein
VPGLAEAPGDVTPVPAAMTGAASSPNAQTEAISPDFSMAQLLLD